MTPIPAKLNDVNTLTAIGRRPAALFYDLRSKVTFYILMFPIIFIMADLNLTFLQHWFLPLFAISNSSSANKYSTQPSICTDLQMYCVVGVTGISIHFCG